MLGATYANLFPARVRALVLDGNLDPVAWARRGSPLSTSMRLRSDIASSRTARALIDRCGRAGRAGCAFSAGTPRATRAKFAALVRRVAAHPQRFAGTLVDAPTLIQSVINAMATVGARPGGFPGWSAFAKRLQALWRRANPKPPPSPAAPGRRYSGPEQQSAVECGESPNPRRARAYPALARRALRRAGIVGIPWPWGDSPCASWPARAADPYLGPWDRPTANPILVANNTGDPQTPYVGGVRMARVLARSRLLTVRGFGHTELLNPSQCAAGHEVAYLLGGVLPPPGSVCRANRRPFN